MQYSLINLLKLKNETFFFSYNVLYLLEIATVKTENCRDRVKNSKFPIIKTEFFLNKCQDIRHHVHKIKS